ncbi:MAG: hypothetical protein ACTS73_07950 [Arsenophonus sp. NEOnobi-MAG3]
MTPVEEGGVQHVIYYRSVGFEFSLNGGSYQAAPLAPVWMSSCKESEVISSFADTCMGVDFFMAYHLSAVEIIHEINQQDRLVSLKHYTPEMSITPSKEPASTFTKRYWISELSFAKGQKLDDVDNLPCCQRLLLEILYTV